MIFDFTLLFIWRAALFTPFLPLRREFKLGFDVPFTALPGVLLDFLFNARLKTRGRFKGERRIRVRLDLAAPAFF